MTVLADAQHFVRAPEWTWYILFYFFLAGLAGGSYFLATLLRYWGRPSDEPAAQARLLRGLSGGCSSARSC